MLLNTWVMVDGSMPPGEYPDDPPELFSSDGAFA
jgi:hypothetical protein